jgi:hypothetical protein
MSRIPLTFLAHTFSIAGMLRSGENSSPEDGRSQGFRWEIDTNDQSSSGSDVIPLDQPPPPRPPPKKTLTEAEVKAVKTAVTDPTVLRGILTELPGVDPDDPEFEKLRLSFKSEC